MRTYTLTEEQLYFIFNRFYIAWMQEAQKVKDVYTTTKPFDTIEFERLKKVFEEQLGKQVD
tara:strand:+ start:553 stop:735 length:183 start_codon:yes stop_codon:yes gene_type:complete